MLANHVNLPVQLCMPRMFLNSDCPMDNSPDIDNTTAADSLLTRAQNALELLRSLQFEHLAEMGVTDVSDLPQLPLQWHIGMRPE